MNDNEKAIDASEKLADGRTLPDLRQVVLLTGELDGVLEGLRSEFEFPVGFRDPGMNDVGFFHEVIGFDQTYIEVCQPMDPDSRIGQRVDSNGDFGFMVVVQVADLDAAVRRAADIGVKPLFTKPHHGNVISQWHPKDFGTLAEFDQMTDPTAWHFTPEVYSARSNSVGQDITTVYIGVADPEVVAQRWAVVLDAVLDGRTVRTGARSIVFTDESEVRGPHTVDVRAADRARVGSSTVHSGVTFRLV